MDGWRAIAIIFVILAHLGQVNSFALAVAPVNFGQAARLGVYIFFFISGFVIYRYSLTRLESPGVFRFYLRRGARLVPALAVYLSVCLLLGMMKLIDFSVINYLAPFTYLTNTTLVEPTWYAGHTWSLSFEEQFYLIFPWFLLWKNLSRWLRLVLICSFVLMIALPIVYTINWIGKTGVLSVWYLMFLGAMFAKYNVPSLLESKKSVSILLFTTGLLGIFAAEVFVSKQAVLRILEALFIPFFIVAGRQIELLHQALNAKLIQLIAGMSYSLYLWQQLATGPWVRSWDLLMVCLVLFCTTLMAYLSKIMLEERFKRLLYRKINNGSWANDKE